MQTDVTMTAVPREGLPGPYYLDFTGFSHRVEKGAFGPFDPAGIPRVDYGALFTSSSPAGAGEGGELHYTPVTIAQYALGCLNRSASGESGSGREIFLAQAGWLRENLTGGRGDIGIWVHHFPFPPYRLAAPWVSAMAQGQGISVLLRAAEMTGDQAYREAADRALKAFAVPLENGGVRCEDSTGIWFEEFPTAPALHVLNGFIFALLGIHDHLLVSGSAEAERFWTEGTGTLLGNIGRFDLGYWSRYDLHRRVAASHQYHHLHHLQLEVLADLLDSDRLHRLAARWRNAPGQGIARFRYRISRHLNGLRHRLGRPEYRVEGISLDGAGGERS